MKVAIIGYGKMGREIERVLLERGHEVASIIDVDTPWPATGDGIDVAVEFSAPEVALDNVKKCLELGMPVVCGTTGWVERLREVEELCKAKKGAFFYASNYCVGVNVAFELNRRLARMMDRFPEYDVTVEETHHTEKKDAPSGTAITLATDIVTGLERKKGWVLGVIGDEPMKAYELGVTSVRRGVAPGTHAVTYESPADVLTLRHEIKSRAGLAAGVVAAAEFLVETVAAGGTGLFTMKDLLGF